MKFYLNDDNNNKNSIFLIGIQKRLKSLGGYKKIMHKCGTVLVNFFAKERISSSLEQDNKSSRSLTSPPQMRITKATTLKSGKSGTELRSLYFYICKKAINYLGVTCLTNHRE